MAVDGSNRLNALSRKLLTQISVLNESMNCIVISQLLTDNV